VALDERRYDLLRGSGVLGTASRSFFVGPTMLATDVRGELAALQERRRLGPSLEIPRAALGLALVYAGCVGVIVLSVIAGRLIDRPIAYFTHDPIQVADVVGQCDGAECSLAGLMSNVGVILWISAAAVTLLTAGMLSAAGESLRRSPYLAFGVLTAVLAVDDLFAIHEYSREWGGRVGLGELRLLTLYALAMAVLLVVFRGFLARTSVWLVPLAGVFYGVSIFSDFVLHTRNLVEDGSKLFGVATWALFLVGTAFQELRSASPPREESLVRQA
jgi:hypothetical protein